MWCCAVRDAPAYMCPRCTGVGFQTYLFDCFHFSIKEDDKGYSQVLRFKKRTECWGASDFTDNDGRQFKSTDTLCTYCAVQCCAAVCYLKKKYEMRQHCCWITFLLAASRSPLLHHAPPCCITFLLAASRSFPLFDRLFYDGNFFLKRGRGGG